jgi:hypothetical protein
LLRLVPRIKVLHPIWLAFLVSFVVWFNRAPLMAANISNCPQPFFGSRAFAW